MTSSPTQPLLFPGPDVAASPPQAFAALAAAILPRSAQRAAITAACRTPEPERVSALLAEARLPAAQAAATRALALRLVEGLRQRQPALGKAGLVQGLLQAFSLSSQEGVALMCLAEALLRIPDLPTRDALIRDKIGGGNWQGHPGHSRSLFVNAAAWGLLLTGRLMAPQSESGLGAALNRLLARSGEPLIRKGVDIAMRLLGEQFVCGETIVAALARAGAREAQGFSHSYDMLGEAALTDADARRYFAAYAHAIEATGRAAGGRGPVLGPGVSVKLSALHPRYCRAHYRRIRQELYPRVRELALLARHHDIGLNIDAEESDRLEISLDLLESLCSEPGLAAWDGIGFAVQAYLKRAPFVIDQLVDLARRSRHRLMIRLVKGAYWDAEIKLAQVQGLDGYPVYTRKVHTDLAYLACARRLLAAPDAVYPQFATHNAQTLAAVVQLAGEEYRPGQYEFQCLHGMGETLYEQVVGDAATGGLGRPCRIYAPVGSHQTLLAYLVRRLLENGANSSFVNRLADAAVPSVALVEDPVARVEALALAEDGCGRPHPHIPLPQALYGATRINSAGMDLADEHALAALADALRATAHTDWQARPLIGGRPGAGPDEGPGPWLPVLNPADRRDRVGQVRHAGVEQVAQAVAIAVQAAPSWHARPPDARAAVLERAAELIQAYIQPLTGLLVREAGKTCAAAIAEVREAVDFLRYYAAQVRADFAHPTHGALGALVCISPWNFPLAIFTGQVAAALAAGNSVLAKPAEQTPLIAAQAVRLLHQAGVPAEVLQFLPGTGELVGEALVGDARIAGVMFTGSTAVARRIARVLAGRLDARGMPLPLIAETGGQNVMIVDASALPEQVVADAIVSAFDSAGQRCSALRVLCVQQEIADSLLDMLRGALAEYCIGNPDRLEVDIGPVIDAAAQADIEDHVQAMRARGHRVDRIGCHEGLQTGSFVIPAVIEIDRLDELEREVFGPVLHVLRYRREELDALLERIAASGYGLTLGLHTRIDETIARVVAGTRVGNVYVNRNMIGAVVGVQPFGGEGLSGTGPKAGGPLYLYRLLASHPRDAVLRTLARMPVAGAAAGADRPPSLPPALQALRAWATAQRLDALVCDCSEFAAHVPQGAAWTLPGPTGERNTYRLLARARVLGIADTEADRLCQLAAALAVGSRMLWLDDEGERRLQARLPLPVQQHIEFVADLEDPALHCELVLHHGEPGSLRTLCRRIAQREGPVMAVLGMARGERAIPLHRLLTEHTLSINTAAAGGNPGLMTLGG